MPKPCSLFLACSTLVFLAACRPSPPGFQKTEVMIPMRDGVRLHTLIYRPAGARGKLPFLITRSPYGWTDPLQTLHGSYRDLAADGYLFVFQDIRGRYQSEGQFVMQRPPRDSQDPKAIDEGTDTYDTIEWLLKNVPNHNGRAGILGISYGGWLTVMALLDPHPALKAASEQASPADMFLGDDFHHNGAFRLSYGFEYAAEMETNKEDYSFPFDRHDTYEWYFSLGPLSNANEKYFHDRLPTWNNFVGHPTYDDYWKRIATWRYLKDVKVPNLNVAGWWDQEDFYGPLKIYETLEPRDTNHWNYLVVGPWNHGGWARGSGHTLGAIDFASDTASYYRQKVQAPWFAYWLKDKGSLNEPEALSFRTGSNTWESYEAWPPKRDIQERKLYLRAGSSLSFDAPNQTSDDAYDSYVSDPEHPVPYRQRPIPATYSRNSGWTTWLLQDQRFVHMRPDVLSWETEPLRDDLTVSGDVVAHLFASTSGSDSDWIVKLIDVYPDQDAKDPKMGGYQLMVANEVMRARFRESFEHPKPVEPNRVIEYAIDLHSMDHSFQRGHRIMVQVQSTWFPLIDRNPQKFVDNIFLAKATDYQKATERVFRTARYPSFVQLPVRWRQ